MGEKPELDYKASCQVPISTCLARQAKGMQETVAR